MNRGPQAPEGPEWGHKNFRQENNRPSPKPHPALSTSGFQLQPLGSKQLRAHKLLLNQKILEFIKFAFSIYASGCTATLTSIVSVGSTSY